MICASSSRVFCFKSNMVIQDLSSSLMVGGRTVDGQEPLPLGFPHDAFGIRADALENASSDPNCASKVRQHIQAIAASLRLNLRRNGQALMCQQIRYRSAVDDKAKTL